MSDEHRDFLAAEDLARQQAIEHKVHSYRDIYLDLQILQNVAGIIPDDELIPLCKILNETLMTLMNAINTNKPLCPVCRATTISADMGYCGECERRYDEAFLRRYARLPSRDTKDKQLKEVLDIL